MLTALLVLDRARDRAGDVLCELAWRYCERRDRKPAPPANPAPAKAESGAKS